MNISVKEFYVAVAVALGTALAGASMIYVTNTQLENAMAELYVDMGKISNRLEDVENKVPE